MGGYRKFLSLTLQRWKRFVVVQNLSPLEPKESLEKYFRKYGPIEGVRLIQNREKSGCYTRKALVLMKSQISAARIIQNRRHLLSPDGSVTTVNYRGSVRKYHKGRFKVFLMLKLPCAQNSVETRTETAIDLTKVLARAYHGILYTSIKLDVDDEGYYDGIATVRFEYEFDEARVLDRTKEISNVVALWTDTKTKGYCALECREKIFDDFYEKFPDLANWGLDGADDAWLGQS